MLWFSILLFSRVFYDGFSIYGFSMGSFVVVRFKCVSSYLLHPVEQFKVVVHIVSKSFLTFCCVF